MELLFTAKTYDFKTVDQYCAKRYAGKKFKSRKEKIAFLTKKGVKLSKDETGVLGVAIAKGKQLLQGKAFHTDRDAEEQFEDAQDNRIQGKQFRLSKPLKGFIL